MMTVFDQNALKLCHHFWEERIVSGMTIVDATVGRGRDTLFLCSLLGPKGTIVGFDIQQEALDSAKALLTENRVTTQVELHLDSHKNMDRYLSYADAVVFNLGYLPGGNHQVGTCATDTIPAIEKALSLISLEGFVTICLYYGGDSGMDEYHALLDYLSCLDSKAYTVLLEQFYNRPNCPPIFIIIERNH